jgi:hypothetical protein
MISIESLAIVWWRAFIAVAAAQALDVGLCDAEFAPWVESTMPWQCERQSSWRGATYIPLN